MYSRLTYLRRRSECLDLIERDHRHSSRQLAILKELRSDFLVLDNHLCRTGSAGPGTGIKCGLTYVIHPRTGAHLERS